MDHSEQNSGTLPSASCCSNVLHNVECASLAQPSLLKSAFCASLLFHGTVFSLLSVTRGVWDGYGKTPARLPVLMVEFIPDLKPESASVEPVKPPNPNPAPGPAIREQPKVVLPAVEPVLPSIDLADLTFPVAAHASLNLVDVSTKIIPAIGVSQSGPEPGEFSEGITAHGHYLSNPKPAYPKAAKRQKQEGLVLLSVSLSATGIPEEVSVKRSSNFALLDDAAVEAVRKWKFVPTMVRGVAVSSKVDVPLEFKIEE